MHSPSPVAERSARERVHYFSRQLITAEDMIDEQNFFLQRLRRHNRFLHGWGVVCGCRVTAVPTSQYPWRVCINGGYVVDPCGNEIELPAEFYFDVAANWPPPEPCIPAGSVSSTTTDDNTVMLAVCYDECDARPVRVHPAGCGCEEASCEYSRVRDSFSVVVLPKLPEYHAKADEADKKWIDDLKKWSQSDRKKLPPAAPCPASVTDPCVVLARIKLPSARTQLETSAIDNDARRLLYSTHALELLMRNV